jgi:DNA (cytosine-5)-methyltransferase 1
MRYPYRNELFFSNHCNCAESPEAFRLEDVTSKIPVIWQPQIIPSSTYFIRQKYCTKDSSFVTFKPQDLTSNCHEPKPTALELAKESFKQGDTILVVQGEGQHQHLEPFVLVDFFGDKVRVRQLLRAGEWIPGEACALNELLWTDRIIEIKPYLVVRKCNIRFILPTEKVPSLYDRHGQADCFFVTRRFVHFKGADIVRSLQRPFPGPMNLGFDPDLKISQPPLATLSLFSGGGNFDRGLEEGGAIQTRWAVEWGLEAVHTYKANCQDETVIFFGSVDEHLARAMAGLFSDSVPRIGEVSIFVPIFQQTLVLMSYRYLLSLLVALVKGFPGCK